MSDVEIHAEAVERLARELRRSIGQHEDVRCDAAATLRALRAALDAAEGERDALLAAIAEATKGMGIAYEAAKQLRAERDAALAALGAAEHENRRYISREAHFASVLSVADGGQYRHDWDAAIRRVVFERDAALAARDAAWRAGRDAAAARSTATVERYGMMRYEWADGPVIARAIRALQPPADLAAEAPGDAVAKEREAWQPLYEAAQNLAASLDGGFVACSHCGEQEATGDMDFVPEFLAAIRALQPPADLAAEAPGDAVARIEALGPALEVLEFHEGSAAPAVEGGEPVVQINGEDFQNALDAVRFAYKALATLRARAGA